MSFTGLQEAIRDGDEPSAGRNGGRSVGRDGSRPTARPRPGPRPAPRPRYEPEPSDDDDDYDDAATERHPVGAAARFVVVLLVLVLGFSIGSAVFGPGAGSKSAKLADWARDKHLGFVVDAIP